MPQATARNVTEKPILLIYDGHRSHETIELREAADKAGIHLFCIPPHTSHRLQPLDVGVFGPLQREWQKRCLLVLDETRKSITRQVVIREYMAARAKSVKEELILSAWRRSGIRPLNPDVFTEEDFAPSYASSTKPPLPVPFPSLPDGFDSLEAPGSSSGGGGECVDRSESPGGSGAERAESSAMTGLSEARGSSSVLNQAPDQEVSWNLPLSDQSATPASQFDEAGDFLHQEGRTNPPNQPRLPTAHTLTHPPHINVVDALRHQTRSVSCSLSRSSSIGQSVSRSLSSRSSSTNQSISSLSEHVKNLEEQLRDAQKMMQDSQKCMQDSQKCMQDSQKRIQDLETASAEWKTHCHFMYRVVSQLQNQLQAKEKKKVTHAKRIQVEARVLTSEEGRLELQQLREEARLKEQQQLEDATRKATEDEARRKRRADGSRVFTGPLNKTRWKEELEDLALALALPDGGKKEEIFERISNQFEEHPELKTNPRFEGLFNPRPRKRARLADPPQAAPGPSTTRVPHGSPMGFIR